VIQMTKWTRLSLAGAPLALALAVSLAVACSGGAGSSLSSCPDPADIAPGGVCTDGTACASTAALPDCPGSAGSLTCNCTNSGWVCADPTGSACYPDAGDEGGGDEGGTDEGGTDEGGDDGAVDATAAPDAAAGDARKG
jgi:hypothetical protein